MIYTWGKVREHADQFQAIFSLAKYYVFILYVIIMDYHTYTNKISQCMLPDSKQQRHCMI